MKSHTTLRFVPAVLALLAGTLLGQDLSNIIDKFSGTWKQNEANSKYGSNLNLRFRRNATGQLEELRGPESHPTVQPVIFDGKMREIEGGNTIEWKQIDAHNFERQIFDGRTSPGKQGALITTRKLHISPDGKTLTEETERVLTDGKPSLTTITYARTSAEAEGLVGRWKLNTVHSDRPLVMKLESAAKNALKVSTDRGMTYTLTFDGKDAPLVARDVIPKMTAAAKQVDTRTIEVTESREGVRAFSSTWQLSPDGRTMTVTTTWLGPDPSREPSIEVYDRQ